MNRAQVSLFVVVGIVLLITVGISLYIVFTASSQEDGLLTGQTFSELSLEMMGVCMPESVEASIEGIVDRTRQELPRRTTSLGTAMVVFDVSSGLNIVEETAEHELEGYSSRLFLGLRDCLAYYDELYFDEQEYLVVAMNDFEYEQLGNTLRVEYDVTVSGDSANQSVRDDIHVELPDGRFTEFQGVLDDLRDSYNNPDSFYNNAVCRQVRDSTGVRPRYPVDFTKNLEDDEFFLSSDSFVLLHEDERYMFYPQVDNDYLFC